MTNCPLTKSQIEVIVWLSNGKTQTDIAGFMNMNRKAIERRLDRARERAGAATTPSLVAMALRKGWIQ